MASPQKKSTFISLAEYLEQEKTAIYKSEYYAGAIFMMAGGSPNHNRISGNAFSELLINTRGSSCEPFNSDQQLMLPGGLYTYPDAMVVCGEIEYDEKDSNAITNPVLIVEVLSPSTSNYDRGEKFEFYRELDSFKEYLTIHQDRVHIEHWYKQTNGQWSLTEYRNRNDTVVLGSISTKLQVDQLYERVEWHNEPRKLTRD
ncbi:MAG: Uma2 family endonuclease [Chloroflexota bacterium]